MKNNKSLPDNEQKRGQLTKRINKKAVELMGREITQTELRLMPYIQNVMMNEQRVDPNKVSGEEREILSLWREKGYIEGGASGLAISIDFWCIINEILWLGYVDLYE